MYIYLTKSDNTVDSEVNDANNVSIRSINADANFTTQSIGGSSKNVIHFNIAPTGITGTGGTLTLQFSDDGINWKTLLDDSSSSIEFTIDNSFTEDYVTIFEPKYLHYRFNYTAGSVTDGSLAIRLMRK